MTISALASSISWLDFSEDDRRKMMEVVSLLKLRETRDELGLGSIRNVFAEMFYPGRGLLIAHLPPPPADLSGSNLLSA